MRLPCPGREELGDGTVAACAMHTADNYHRIAGFLNGQGDSSHRRIARFLHGRGPGAHQADYAAENIDLHLQSLLDQLSSARAALSAIEPLA
ncbi:MAG: hypothetical protein M3065_00430 [Actinomycetota bacterium]|nr:hypothetical protein [Actinomycetota bacterium]